MAKEGGGSVQASIAHLVLAGTSVWSLTAAPRQDFSYFGTFGNLLFHGGVGFFHFQNPKMSGTQCPPPAGVSILDTCCGFMKADLKSMYCASCQASRVLALPSTVAHLYIKAGYRKDFAFIHILSGAIPFTLYLMGKDPETVGNLVVIGNIMSLFYISLDTKNTWGLVLTGAAIFSFLFVNSSTISFEMQFNTLYPFTLAFYEYCFLQALGAQTSG